MTIEFTLEIPIDSVEAAEAAAPHLRPRDRFELCEDLASEGWTPTPELIREVRRRVPSEVEVVAMIRPRLADSRAMLDLEAFLATPAVLAASLAEIEDAARAGADSVAIGLLTAAGTVDLDACGTLAGGLDRWGSWSRFFARSTCSQTGKRGSTRSMSLVAVESSPPECSAGMRVSRTYPPDARRSRGMRLE